MKKKINFKTGMLVFLLAGLLFVLIDNCRIRRLLDDGVTIESIRFDTLRCDVLILGVDTLDGCIEIDLP